MSGLHLFLYGVASVVVAGAQLGMSAAVYVALVHPMVATVALTVVAAAAVYAAYRALRSDPEAATGTVPLAVPRRARPLIPIRESGFIRLLRGEGVFESELIPG